MSGSRRQLAIIGSIAVVTLLAAWLLFVTLLTFGAMSWVPR